MINIAFDEEMMREAIAEGPVIFENTIFIIACVLHGKNILIYFSLQRKYFPCYFNDHFEVKKGEF